MYFNDARVFSSSRIYPDVRQVWSGRRLLYYVLCHCPAWLGVELRCLAVHGCNLVFRLSGLSSHGDETWVLCALISLGGVTLSPFGTLATIWPIVLAPYDRWWWVWSNHWNENWQAKQSYSEKTCHSASVSTTNPIWSDLGSNPGLRGGKPAAIRLSYITAIFSALTYRPAHLFDMFYGIYRLGNTLTSTILMRC
jgi:hypothetical protein